MFRVQDVGAVEGLGCSGFRTGCLWLRVLRVWLRKVRMQKMARL